MERLNIAFFTDSYLPGVDGVVTSILTFRKELEKRGHNVYVFASSDRRKSHAGRNTFLYSSVEFKPYPQYNVALFPYASVLKMRELDIDVVHAQTPFVMGFAGMMGAKMLRAPLVGSFHTLVNNGPIIEHYYPKNRHLKRLTSRYVLNYLRFFYRRCDAVIAPTVTIEKMLKGYRIPNTTVVSNAIDTGKFNPGVDGGPTRERLGIRENERMVLYVGRQSREKKIETMLRAAKLLSKKGSGIKFVIAGTGPAESYYRKMSARLGLNETVQFMGFVDQRMLPGLYAACDLLCMPSTFETQGIVCLEAMAVGKPVVGADRLALKEIIKNGVTGEKFTADDYIACARKIEKVLNNPEEYKSSAARFSKDFSADKVTNSLLEVYRLNIEHKGID